MGASVSAAAVREDLHSAIENRLRRIIAARISAAESYGEPYAMLWRMAESHVLGGKLLRPRLLVEMRDALDTTGRTSEDRAVVIELAAAVEILHYAFLLHDDVIDGDAHRRGARNLIGAARDAHPLGGGRSTDAGHWARSGAILMGDLLLSAVHQVFARADVAHPARRRLLDLLDHTITETVAGELADVALSDGVVMPDLRTILAMTAHKTATYTIEFPLRTAAILAGCAASTEESLTTVGRRLGVAFQLQDDLLSVFGDPGTHGKDAYSDLREGKETALIAYARMTTAWTTIEPRFGQEDLTRDEAGEMAERLRSCGAEAYVRNLIQDELSVACASIEAAEAAGSIPPEAAAVLLALVRRIDGRRS